MKRLLLAALAFTMLGAVAYAGTQVDEGYPKDDPDGKSVFVVVRFARQPSFPVVVSKDKIVVWDSVSADGATITTTTTSHDALVAGITIDEIPGSSRDNSAARDLGYNNWGRLRVWGRHVGVVAVSDTKAGGVASAAGDRVSTSSTAGSAGLYSTVSNDYLTNGVALYTGTEGLRHFANTSKDSAGVILNRSSATSWDVFVKCM